MKPQLHYIIRLILILLWLPWTQAAECYTGTLPSNTPQFTAAQLLIQGQPRYAWVYKPNRFAPMPLMIFFSGTGSTLEFSTLDELGKAAVQEFAERAGVVLIFALPQAVNHGDWDHGADGLYWETAQYASLDSAAFSDPILNPDLNFTRALIDEANLVYPIDNNRIYFNGFSSGAFFSYFAAAVLHEQVAAFAATGGGLVLSQTTAGQPVCQVPSVPADVGSSRSCNAAGWTTQTCVTPGAIPRPLAPEQVDWVPPAYLQANDDDNSVPFVHSCQLAHALEKNSATEIHIIHQGGGHSVNAGYLDASWNFLQTKRLDSQLERAAERIFNFAAARYPTLFNPPVNAANYDFGYYYRYYPGSNSYLGLQDHNIYYALPTTGIQAAGSISTFLPQAKAAGF